MIVLNIKYNKFETLFLNYIINLLNCNYVTAYLEFFFCCLLELFAASTYTGKVPAIFNFSAVIVQCAIMIPPRAVFNSKVGGFMQLIHFFIFKIKGCKFNGI